MTTTGAASFLFAVPAGSLADRIGPRRMSAIGAFLTAALHL